MDRMNGIEKMPEEKDRAATQEVRLAPIEGQVKQMGIQRMPVLRRKKEASKSEGTGR